MTIHLHPFVFFLSGFDSFSLKDDCGRQHRRGGGGRRLGACGRPLPAPRGAAGGVRTRRPLFDAGNGAPANMQPEGSVFMKKI